MSSRFGVIRKKLKTWTHLPEKPLSKNKGTRSARARCPKSKNKGTRSARARCPKNLSSNFASSAMIVSVASRARALRVPLFLLSGFSGRP